MPANKRMFGIADDAVSGGSEYDDLTAGAIPDASLFWPITGGNFNPGLGTLNRDNEARGRRARTAPEPFTAEPVFTIPVPLYRSVGEKVLKKLLGGTDTVTPGSGTGPQTHSIASLATGNLPAVHAQLVRDDLNHKGSGCVINSATFNLPFDDNASINLELLPLYAKHDAAAPPTAAFSGLSESTMKLRDAQAWFDGGNEVQTVGVGAATAGTFTLSFGGQTTAAIAYNATAAAVDSALELLSTIGAGNVTVTGAAPTWTVTFTGDLGGRDVAQLTGNGAGLTGGALTITTTTPGGVAIPDLTGFELTFANNVNRKRYAKRNVVSQTIGTPSKVRKLWYPAENKVGPAQDVSFKLNFGNATAAEELARDFMQIRKLVFEVVGDVLTTTPAGLEIIRFTLYNALYTGGGAEDLSARDDIESSYEGGAFYSETDANDLKVEIVNSSLTAIT